ncbi:MAG: type IV pilus assembly protein PilM [Pirellulales bacterium]
MARSPFTWGIDIGKCGLKALRGRLAPGDPRKFVAEGFDYIEYPMLLSQPEADATELVRAALEEFTKRNDLRGDRVAIAVPGQMGLSKFIKLPPIEAKKIPDIVKYEARQQIPFPMDQVVWDWQRLAGGMEEGGFVLDAEVALFAMKREQVYKALAPLDAAGIAVDVLQLAPVSLANMVLFDQPPAPVTDPDQPPASTVVVSIGVDTTDIVITNGLRIWQRSMPVGGSSFTKAIVKDLKLTFAKAEHLKRNAVRAEDPKAVFKAMRPVFNEFTAELQRSLNYFTGTDRTATIGKVVLLGNAARLRGLSDFVAQQLKLDVQRPEKFDALEGDAVLSAPAFKENRLAFGTAYGLALQAAGGGQMNTNLMPREIIRDRIIEEKRPWAVGGLVGLLAAGLVSFTGLFFAWKTYADPGYAGAFAAAEAAQRRSQAESSAVDEAKAKRQAAIDQQGSLVKVHERRFQTLDMLRAVESLLPRDDAGDVPDDPADRQEIHVESIDCQYFPDLSVWFAGVKKQWHDTHPVSAAPAATDGEAAPAEPGAEQPAADPSADAAVADGQAPADGQAAADGPKGPGWVIQIMAHHYHNEDRHKPDEGEQFVRSTLVKNLLGEGDKVLVSAGPLAGQRLPVAELGIGYPVIVESSPIRPEQVPRMQAAGSPAAAAPGQPGQPAVPMVELSRYNFTLQFAWQPVVPGKKPPPPPAAAAAPVGE